jgi:4'-phosphopantetheinyl transferase
MSMEARATDHCLPIPTPLAGVRLYRVGLAVAPAAWKRLVALLSTDEREHAALYRVDADRTRFVVVRAALRLVLADAGLGPPECLTIVAGRYGKPELSHASTLRFNVAHSGEVGLIALAEGCAVGVDVECVRARPDLAAVARRFFTVAEARALDRLAAAEHAAAFFRCWVRKEACTKAIGLGLRAPFDAFEVGVGPPSPAARRVLTASAGKRIACELIDLDLGADYAGALAVTNLPAVT